MAEVENLEKLSNNEIRLKCIEFGFPNVPVTDSSRKVLLKKLKEAMTNTAPKESLKTSNRRETINIGKTALPEVDAQKNRRTISAVTSVSAKEDNAPTSIPISTRRRSVQKDSTEPTKPTKNVGKPLQTILIEDDEDDMELINAADNAERASTASSSVTIENITGRRKSRSVSVPKVTEIINTVTVAAKQRALTPLTEEKREIVQHELTSKTAKSQNSKSENAVNIVSVQKLPTLEMPVGLTQQTLAKAQTADISSHYSKLNTTSSVYSTPSSMRYTAGSVAPIITATASGGGGGFGYLGSTTSAYRSKYTAENILNELSDTDAANNDGCKSPFLSSFARDLERRRSIGRSTTGTSYNPYARRSSGIRGRGSKADISIGEILVALGRKYHLKNIFYFLIFACVSIFIYVYLSA